MLKNKVSLIYFYQFMIIGLMVASIGPLLPTLSTKLNIDLAEIGFIFSLRALGFMFGTLLFGRLFDKFNGHFLMAISVVSTAIILFMIGCSNSWWLIASLFFVFGFTESGLDTGGNVLLIWVYGDKVAPYMNTLHFCFGIGALLGPLLVAFILSKGLGVYELFLVQSLVLLSMLPALFFARAPQKRLVEDEKSSSKNTSVVLALLFCTLCFLYCGAEIGFNGWIFSIAVKELGLSSDKAGIITSGFWSAFIVGRLISIIISNKFKIENILLFCFWVATCSLFCLSMLKLSLFILWVMVVVFGLFMAPIFPLIMSLAQQKMDINGKMTSYFLLGSSLGAMFLPGILGLVIDKFGVNVALLTLSVDLILALVILFVILKGLSAEKNVLSLEN